MEYVCLNPRVLDSATKIQEHLWRELHFQNDYGMNLAALYDELSTLIEPVSILCLRFDKDGTLLYPHVEPVYRVIAAAARVNDHLHTDWETLPAV